MPSTRTGTPRQSRISRRERNTPDIEAGQVSAELARRGTAAGSRVHVVVEVVSEDTADTLPMAAIAQAGGAFDWLADEPDPYAGADLAQRQADCPL